MRKTAFLIALTVTAGVAGVAVAAAPQSGPERLDKRLAGRVAGQSTQCVSLMRMGSSEVFDGTAIVYKGSGSRLYVNRPKSGSLSQLDQNVMLVTRSPTSMICKNDVVDLVDRYSGVSVGFVMLGDFEPYDLAPKR